MAEYKNLDKYDANMLYFVSDGDKILLFIGDDSIQSVLTENILLDVWNDDVTISNFNSGDRMESVLRNALFNIVALSKRKFEVKSDIPEIGDQNNGKFLRISDDGTLIWDDAPKGEKGDKGNPGDVGALTRMVMVYKSGKNDTEQLLLAPTAPMGGDYDFKENRVILPTGWYSSDCDDKGRPLEPPIYMSSRTFSNDDNFTEPDWSTPIRITGDDGKAGTDGNSLEFIYYLTNDPDKDNVPTPYNYPEDEYVPKHQGWTDSPRGVDEEYQWEYFALRRKSNNSWSNWSVPALWSNYGVNGQDGDGVEYIYARTNSENIKPDISIPSDSDDPQSSYQSDSEYIPSNKNDKGEPLWWDNPQGVEDVDGKRVEWVSSRKYYAKTPGARKMWQDFSEPTVWAKFSKDGQDGDGIEYVYARTNSEDSAPSLKHPNNWDDPTSPYQTQLEYLPTDDDNNKIWTDDPQGVKDEDGQRVEWVASRRYCIKEGGTRKMWQQFSLPKVWAKFSKDGVDGKPADIKIQKYIFGSKSYPFIGADRSQINTGIFEALVDFDKLPLGRWNVIEGYNMSPTEMQDYMKTLDRYELVQSNGRGGQNPTMFIKIGNYGQPNYTSICGSGSIATGGISFDEMFPNKDYSIHIWCLEGTQTHEYDATTKEWKLSDTIKWNLPLYKTKLQQSCKGDTGETGKIGNVVYPAGEYDDTKVYHATDKKSPYVVDPSDEEYYMLKENNTYVGAKESYDLTNGINGEPLYNMFCIDPDDATTDNSQQIFELTVIRGERITISCDMPEYRNTFISKMNGKKYGYVKLNVRGFPNNEIKVLKKYYTLDSTGENLIVASKYIYSVDGVSETWLPDKNQTPSENASSSNPVWEKFESFEALYAKIGIIENGTIGGAVYSGDFMFSQKGVDKNGNVSTSYQNFNRNHIYDSQSNFKPNVCIDFNNGKMYACGGNIEFTPGEIYLSGHIRKQETIIDMNDLDKYLLEGSGKSDGGYFKYEFDFRKLGSFVVLTGHKTNYKKDILNINLPSTETFYYKSLSDDAKKQHLQYLRGIVGNTYIIYNSTEYDPSDPPQLEDMLQGNVGIPFNYCTDNVCGYLGEGHFLKIEIELGVDSDGREKIYPIVTKGKMNFYTDNDPWVSGRPRQ
jgi:hypothetical protein